MSHNSTVESVAKAKRFSTTDSSDFNAVATSSSDASLAQQQKQKAATKPVQDAIKQKSTQTKPIALENNINVSLEPTDCAPTVAMVAATAPSQPAGRHRSFHKIPTKSTLAGNRPITHASTSSLSRKNGGSQLFYSTTTGSFSGAGYKRQHSSASLHHGGSYFSAVGGGSGSIEGIAGSVSPVLDTFAPLMYRTGSRVWEDIQETKGTGHVKRTSSTTKMYILGTDEESPNSSSDDEESGTMTGFHKRSRQGSRSKDSTVGGSRNESQNRPPVDDYNPLNYQAELVDDSLSINSGLDSISASHFSFSDNENYNVDGSFDAAESPSVGRGTHAIPGSGVNQGFAPTRNRLISAVDWLLGVDTDESLFSLYAEKQQLEQEELEQRRRVALAAVPSARGNGISPRARRKRDEEQGLNVDVVLLLGVLSLAAGEIF